MIGYMDPTLGKKRQQALSEYLRQQSAQRSQAAGAMRGIATSAFGGGYGAGNQFLKGGSHATPDKFAFAGVKPSLKALLGMVGQTMGHGGGLPDFRIYGQAAPVGGLSWGGSLPTPPSNPALAPTAPPPSAGGGSGAPVATPSAPAVSPPANSVVAAPATNLSYGDLANSIQSSLPGLMTGGIGGLAGLLANIGLNASTGYNGPGPTPILGTLKYDQLQ